MNRTAWAVVFYNVYVGSRVDQIVREQLRLVNGLPVHVHTIGKPLKIPAATTVTSHARGGEDVTLHDLWKFCRGHTNATVVYLHSKGTFHASPANTYLRRFLTVGALSEECVGMGKNCNVCSSRMSPLPHPHTPGNMWAAKCDYVANLIDPSAFQSVMQDKKKCACRGCGRYAFEHWIHSHPLVKPCDLFDDPSYVWGYDGVPKAPFVPKKTLAPRFSITAYIKSNDKCKKHGQSRSQRQDEYWRLYHTLPGRDWWGNRFF